MVSSVGHGRAFYRVFDLLAGLGLRPMVHPAGASARCPAHDDRKPSLGLSDGDGKVLLICRAGCTTEQILGALGLSWVDLFDGEDDWRAPFLTRSGRRLDPDPPHVETVETRYGAMVFDVARMEAMAESAARDLAARSDPTMWVSRAAEWQRAAPRPGEATGDLTVDEVNAVVGRCERVTGACLTEAWRLAPDPAGEPPPTVTLPRFTESDLRPSDPERPAWLQVMRRGTDAVRSREDRAGVSRDPRFWMSAEQLAEARTDG